MATAMITAPVTSILEHNIARMHQRMQRVGITGGGAPLFKIPIGNLQRSCRALRRHSCSQKSGNVHYVQSVSGAALSVSLNQSW